MPLSTLCKKEALHSPVGTRCVLGASDQLDTEHMCMYYIQDITALRCFAVLEPENVRGSLTGAVDG